MLNSIASALSSIAGRPVDRNVDLKSLSRWQIGGIGKIVVQPQSAQAVKDCLAYLRGVEIPRIVIGDGSNILFDDRGFDGVVLKLGRSLSQIEISGTRVTAEGGAWVPQLVRRVGLAGLSGLEHAIGIPGTLGGLVVMNGGSQRHGVGEVLVEVEGCGPDGAPFRRGAEECKFRYRGSTIQDDHLIVLRVQIALQAGDRNEIRSKMIGILADRRRKFPKSLPNCGSVFLSNPAMYDVVGPPGAAIERTGLKGKRIGQAQFSPQHANFIVNNGGATSDDVLELIRLARDSVFDATGFLMDAEVRHVAPDGEIMPAHKVAPRRQGFARA